MHSFCCCSSVSVVARPRSRSLTSSQSGTSRRAVSTASSRGGLRQPRRGRVHADAEQHVLVDRDRQRIGPLEDHAHRLAQLD